MAFSLRRWRPRHLLAAWAAYWATLGMVVLRTPVMTAWRLTHLPEGHSSISAGLTNAVLNVTMSEDGATVWAGSVHLGTLALWLAVPPLVLWLVWLLLLPRPEVHRGDLVFAPGPNALTDGSRPQLGGGAMRDVDVRIGADHAKQEVGRMRGRTI
jgi:hypothetical protein